MRTDIADGRAIPVSVLHVEDERVDRWALNRALAAQGLSNAVVEAEDGQAALQALQARAGAGGPADARLLVVLDLNMPNMRGDAFLERLRSDPDLRHTIVFVLSSSDRKSDIEGAYDRGVAGYVVKHGKDSFSRMAKLIVDYADAVRFPND